MAKNISKIVKKESRKGVGVIFIMLQTHFDKFYGDLKRQTATFCQQFYIYDNNHQINAIVK